jgi:hypothetical protein
MKLYGLKIKSEIPEDGNCQFASVSDQVYGGLEQTAYCRKKAVKWILKNQNAVLPNGSLIKNYIYEFASVTEFCDDMSREGIWGNHLTLVAMSEFFGRKIIVLSSVESTSNLLLEINPKKIKCADPILLSHYAEYHYGSICYDAQNPIDD